MNDVRDKLAFLLGTKGLVSGAQWKSRALEERRQIEAGGREIHHAVPGEVVGGPDGGFYRVREDVPLDSEHGGIALGAALDAVAAHISLSANDTDLLQFNPRTAVFVDTETTGLMGGTGTTAFLVGVGSFHEDCFRLEQCFMRDFDDEEPMLHYLAGRFAQAETLVSFNGKSFDLPLLRTRFIANRVPCRLDALMHLDLVHASRRIWKTRLRDCSLGNIEREVMGIVRHGDVNSALIPQLWLDYLHTRDARPLRPVFYHHKMDILSLASLTAHLSRMIGVPDGKGFDHDEDRLALLRLHFRQKRYEDVLGLAETLLASLSDRALRKECLEMTAFAAKRRSRWETMEIAWLGVIEEFPRHLTARAEMAKHYEHRKRDLPGAARFCAEAIQVLGERTQRTMETDAEWSIEGFRRRLERIERKLRGGAWDEPE